ncbi:MAG: hypothetical protein IPJ81_09070 [Chitinophagaceae bacterium]|nr:hypothetical protein [Chitinophagaceae bacterium]
MKTTFNIRTNNFDYSNAQLFVELAPQQVSLLVLDVNNCFNNYLSYSLTGDDIHEKILQLKKFLMNHYCRINIKSNCYLHFP